jgi:hypothetical protein
MTATAPLQVHHSLAGVYDMKKETKLAGTVTSVKFTNPHASLAVGRRGNCEVYETKDISSQIRH